MKSKNAERQTLRKKFSSQDADQRQLYHHPLFLWCRDQWPLLLEWFGPWCFLCPDDSLYRQLLPRLNAEYIEWALADWIRSTLCAQADDPIALDSKTVRGARKLCCRSWSARRPMKSPVAQALLSCLPVDGRIIAADALHTQKNFMQCVDALSAKTVLTVKNKQPTLYADLATYFADPHASFEQMREQLETHEQVPFAPSREPVEGVR